MNTRIAQLLTIAALLSFIPLLLIARARVVDSKIPRIQIIPDMDQQPRYKSQAKAPFFADGQAMRPDVPGTVARGELRADDAFYRGMRGDGFVKEMPVAPTAEMLARGRDRFDVFCATCHGVSGMGDGPIAQRADKLQEGTWTPPSSLHTEIVRGREDGHLFNTIGNGIRNMPAYGHQIVEADRWAIVAYIRALQMSQGAALSDLPAEARAGLEQ